jgi:cell division protein FtsN
MERKKKTQNKEKKFYTKFSFYLAILILTFLVGGYGYLSTLPEVKVPQNPQSSQKKKVSNVENKQKPKVDYYILCKNNIFGIKKDAERQKASIAFLGKESQIISSQNKYELYIGPYTNVVKAKNSMNDLIEKKIVYKCKIKERTR